MKIATAVVASILMSADVSDAKEMLVVKEDPSELEHSRPSVKAYTCR